MSDIQHESGWREVARVIGILVVGAVVLIASLIVLNTVVSRNRGFGDDAAVSKTEDFSKEAVVAEIDATSANCAPDFPLEISLTNVTDRDVLEVGFMIQVSEAGHSTKYHAFGFTDRIIPPERVYGDCYAIPPFRVGSTNPVAADGVPYNLASPRYEITVSGTLSRGEH